MLGNVSRDIKKCYFEINNGKLKVDNFRSHKKIANSFTEKNERKQFAQHNQRCVTLPRYTDSYKSNRFNNFENNKIDIGKLKVYKFQK